MSDDSNDVQVLTSAPNELEAAAIVSVLEREGIQAVATGEYTSGFRAEAPGQVSILVKSTDFAGARKVLDDARIENAEIDWSDVDVGEPEH